MDGDILLVACGKKVNIRNLRNGTETKAADEAVRRYSSLADESQGND